MFFATWMLRSPVAPPEIFRPSRLSGSTPLRAPIHHASASFATPTIVSGTLPSAMADQITSLSPWAIHTSPPMRPARYSGDAVTSAGLVNPSLGQNFSSATIHDSWFM